MAALPTVHVVGLGPGDERYLTADTVALLQGTAPVRLRTAVHPAAPPGLASYDEWYERATSFAALYGAIVDDLVALATTHGVVVYAVPGSPMVAEHTVELLLERRDVTVVVHPAVSVLDVACAALRIDPLRDGLSVIDALTPDQLERASGPTLVLQVYAPEVAAVFADRLDPDCAVVVLWHSGLPEARTLSMTAAALADFADADHLTSLYLPEPLTAARAVADLEVLMTRLRTDCPWDQEQTHASLARHLLEEAYEALDALEEYAHRLDDPTTDEVTLRAAAAHVEEELGDLLFQIVFHAHLGREDQHFDLGSISRAVHDKLVFRHPHVFGDVTATTADDVATNWETLKKTEKGRESVTDGIATHLPALTLWAKLRRKATSVGLTPTPGGALVDHARAALDALSLSSTAASDATADRGTQPWADLLVAVSDLAQYAGVDAEAVLRTQALQFRQQIREAEGLR